MSNKKQNIKKIKNNLKTIFAYYFVPRRIVWTQVFSCLP